MAKLGISDRLLILKKPFDVAEMRQMTNALAEKWRLGRYAERNRELESARAIAEGANRAKSSGDIPNTPSKQIDAIPAAIAPLRVFVIIMIDLRLLTGINVC